MDNMTLMISQKGDLVIGDNGIMQIIDGADTTAQNIRMTIKAWKEDFPLVPEHGTDHYSVFGVGMGDDRVKEAYREAIFQESEIAQINSLTVERNGRTVNVAFEALTEKGMEVSGRI